MEKILTFDAEVVTDTKLIVEGAAEVKIDASESITLEIAPDTYVLGSIGSFNTASSWVGAYVNELVRESIGTGGTLADALLNIKDYVMDEIEIGVNQVITQIENEYVSNSTLTTTLASELGPSRAAILDIQTTYATQTEAQAYSIDAIKASFGGNSSSSAIEAYIGSIAITHVDADSALASTVDVLIATLNETTVRIDTVDEINITQNAAIDVATVNANTALSKLADLEEARDGVVDTFYVTTAPASGMSYGDYWVDTDSWTGTKYLVYRYEALNGSSTGTLAWRVNTGETAVALGKAYRADVLAGTAQSTADGKIKTWYQTTAPVLTASDIGDIWVDTDASNLTKTWSGTAWVDIINTQSNTAYTWSATSSKMITAPDGSVTGWSFGDGSNIQSYFKIKATNFSISDGTTGYTPFLIDGTDIKFNGLVEFSNVNGTPSHTSGLLSARPLTAVLGSTYTATDAPLEPVLYTYTSSGWIQGGDPDAITQSTLNTALANNTTVIDGGKITTGTIDASLVNVTNLNAGSIKAGVIYNTGGSASNYTMKVDLDNGEIHIK